MGALIAVPNLSQPVTMVIDDLQYAHDAIAEDTLTYLKQRWSIPVKTFGVDMKAKLVPLPTAHPLVLAKSGSHPFGEIQNQLAHVERLIDALRWATGPGQQATKVLGCHPTSTSTGRNHSHDLCVGTTSAEIVFEVSDSGGNGNNNKKMTNDLARLSNCTCSIPQPRGLLAVSLASKHYLCSRGLATPVPGSPVNSTHIMEP